MDNFTRIYLADIGRDIEKRHATSDNKKLAIKADKLEIIKWLVTKQKITETESREAAKIIGVKLAC